MGRPRCGCVLSLLRFFLLFSVALVNETLPAFSFSRLLDLVARTKSVLTSNPVMLLSRPVPSFCQISDNLLIKLLSKYLFLI